MVLQSVSVSFALSLVLFTASVSFYSGQYVERLTSYSNDVKSMQSALDKLNNENIQLWEYIVKKTGIPKDELQNYIKPSSP